MTNYKVLTSEEAIPDEALEWITAEILELLRCIPGPYAAKKRYTLIRVAVAQATPGKSENAVFKSSDPLEQERVCARQTWYGKWKHEPEIGAALDACRQRLQDWRDTKTLLIEAEAAQLRRRAIAEGSLDALKGLRQTALNTKDRADLRTEASRLLLVLADPALREVLTSPQAALPVEIKNLDAFIESELARLAGGSEVDAAEPVAGAPDST